MLMAAPFVFRRHIPIARMSVNTKSTDFVVRL